jgi:MSHA pilin protein MshB
MTKGKGLISKSKASKGFTLIELVIVVVILGFLAVTAIPKFIDLTDQAKQANIEGMAGGFATGISLARAQWEAEGRQKDSTDRNSVNYDGTILLLTNEDTATGIRPGYVVGLTTGSGLGGGFTVNNCVEIWQNILQQPPTITSSLTTLNGNDGDTINYFVGKSTATGVDTLCHYYLKETLDRDAATGDYEDPANDTDTGNSFTYQPAKSLVSVHVNN